MVASTLFLPAAVFLCTAMAATTTAAAASSFECVPSNSIYACLCSGNNTFFTSQLCSYVNQANSTTTDFSLWGQLHDTTFAATLFAVNNSAYTALTPAETSAYTSDIANSVQYLVVPNVTYQNLTTLQNAGSSFPLTTLLGSHQLILVTTTGNKTVLNDDDSCVVDTCLSLIHI